MKQYGDIHILYMHVADIIHIEAYTIIFRYDHDTINGVSATTYLVLDHLHMQLKS